MFRDLVSSRLIQAGLVFFVIVVGGSLLYYWHVHRTTINELGPIPVAVESMENGSPQTNTAPTGLHNNGVTKSNETTDTPSSDETERLANETENLDIANAFLPDDFVTAEEAPAEDVPVSPYGFGPYPEIPADYPGTEPMWEADLDALGFTEAQKKRSELLSRVLIKLWVEQGIGSRLGGAIDSVSEIVYPYHPNTIYVKRTVLRDPDGTERGVFARIKTPGNMFITAEETDRFRLTGETPPGVRVLQIDTDGIDPYDFLNLPR